MVTRATTITDLLVFHFVSYRYHIIFTLCFCHINQINQKLKMHHFFVNLFSVQTHTYIFVLLQARGFTCRAFTYAVEEKRCYLSGDDSISLNNAPLIIKRDAVYAEKQCSISKYCQIRIKGWHSCKIVLIHLCWEYYFHLKDFHLQIHIYSYVCKHAHTHKTEEIYLF